MNIYEGRPVGEPADETRDTVFGYLDKLGISYRTACHEAAYTMEQCAMVEEALGAPIFKNLFLQNRQGTEFYLVMLPAGKTFKTKYLSSQIGCSRLSFAGEEPMVRLLHIHPGSVSPLGLMFDSERKVMAIVDRDLLRYASVGCHPCLNTATVAMRLDDLVSTLIPSTGHEIHIVDLPNE